MNLNDELYQETQLPRTKEMTVSYTQRGFFNCDEVKKM